MVNEKYDENKVFEIYNSNANVPILTNSYIEYFKTMKMKITDSKKQKQEKLTIT